VFLFQQGPIMSEKKTEISSFEISIDKLEQTIKQMESGKLSLEESLSKFEEGVKLINDCQSTLKNAQQRIQILNNNGELNDFSKS
jgi:exodeoxyribonuclease VII small subunit